MWGFPVVSPVIEYVVAVEPVFSDMVLYESEPIFSSILYPVICCWYVCDGGTQDRVIDVGDTAVAVRAGAVVSLGIADASLEGPVPAELIAETR